MNLNEIGCLVSIPNGLSVSFIVFTIVCTCIDLALTPYWDVLNQRIFLSLKTHS